MKICCYNFLIFTVIFFFSLSVFSQEKLIPLKSNPAYQKVKKPIYSIAKKALELPFIDDFSTTEVYPDAELWEDHYVYINSTIAKKPPTVGVASFDGLDENGQPWDDANPGEEDSRASEPSDTLTSKPIDLSDLNNSESLYLSFFYQPEGFASRPERDDSLILQVKDNLGLWETIWRQEGVKYHDFKSVILHLGDSTKYLHNDFQFRFYNYATQTGYNDFWHLDYVELDEGRFESDTIYKDLAFVEQPTSIFKEYSEMTLGQFFTNQDVYLNDQHAFTVSNLDKDVFPSDYYCQVILKNTNEMIFELGPLGTDDVPARNQFIQNINTLEITNNPNETDRIFISNPLSYDTLQIEMKYIIDPNNDVRSENDTISRSYSFSNQLAYDDGIVDVGYAITGEGTENAEIAQKYEIEEREDLYGILIHFARINLTQTNEKFDLKVWSSIKGAGNDSTTNEIAVIEDLAVAYPESDNHTGFVLYCFDEPIVGLLDQFYIGIKQKTSNGLHIGFDRNNNSNDKLFYNIFDEWLDSDIEGSLMIRPIVGSPLPDGVSCVCSIEGDSCNDINGNESTFGEDCTCTIVGTNDITYNSSFTIFPNPANEYIRIGNLNSSIFDNDTQVELFDTSGKLVKSFNYAEANFYVGDIANGVYLIKVQNDKHSGIRKFVKTD